MSFINKFTEQTGCSDACSITLTAGGFRFTPPPLPLSSLPESESTSLPESAFWGTVASSSSSSSSLPPPALLPSLSDELAGCRQTVIRRLRWISHCNAQQSRKPVMKLSSTICSILCSLAFHSLNTTGEQRERCSNIPSVKTVWSERQHFEQKAS